MICTALAVALFYAAVLGYFELNPAVVEHLASDLIELSTRHNFAHWLATGAVCRGWARSASGDTAAGIAGIEEGIGDYRAMGSMLFLPFFLALKAEALYFADRTSEALEAITEAEALVERSEGRWWCAELHRLRGVFLAALGADETQIEASFCEAIRHSKGAEVGFARETRRSNLRGIPSAKSERVRRTWIPTTSLLTFLRARPLNRWIFRSNRGIADCGLSQEREARRALPESGQGPFR